MEADLEDVFLDVEQGFAVFATVTGGDSVAGFFFGPYYRADAGGAVGVGSEEPVFKATATAAAHYGLEQGAPLIIDGTAYVILEPEPDGSGLTPKPDPAGMVDLRLQLQPT